jgi:hypothetical protein
MTEAEVAKLREAGIDDAVILDMQKEEAGKNGQAGPVVEATSELPDIDPNTPSTVYQQAQAAGVPTEGRPQTWAQTGAELGGLVVDNAGKIAGVVGGGGALLAANQLRKGMQARAGATAAQAAAQQATANAALQQAQGVQQRFDARAAQQAAARAGAVAPSPILDAQGRPMQVQARPVAPAPMAPTPAPVAQAAEQGLANRVKQTAASRITGLMPSMGEMLGTAGRVASRFAGPAMLALESRDLGPKTPQTGRMRGMEINPLTNAPWTPEQIAQYEANPAQYDQQMAPPQFRR